jgi:hypothetical protein
VGYAPEGAFVAMATEEWDDERLGNDEPPDGEAA